MSMSAETTAEKRKTFHQGQASQNTPPKTGPKAGPQSPTSHTPATQSTNSEESRIGQGGVSPKAPHSNKVAGVINHLDSHGHAQRAARMAFHFATLLLKYANMNDRPFFRTTPIPASRVKELETCRAEKRGRIFGGA